MEIRVEAQRREWHRQARLASWALALIPQQVARGVAMSFGEKPEKAMRGGRLDDLVRAAPGYDAEFDDDGAA